MKIFPVAKATELLVVNDTDWRAFAEATGTQRTSELATIEGVTAAGAALLRVDGQPDGRAGKRRQGALRRATRWPTT